MDLYIHPQGIALGILRHQRHKFSVLEGLGGEKEASMYVFKGEAFVFIQNFILCSTVSQEIKNEIDS